MSALDEFISANVLIADFVNVENSGKLNIVGGGLTTLESGPDGMTPPFSVLATLDFKPSFDGGKFQFGFELVDKDGHPVELDGPEGKSRIQLSNEQTAGLAPNSPEFQRRLGVPPGVIPIGLRSVVTLGTGLPLVPDNFYQWRLTVDSQEVPGGNQFFYVKSQTP